MRVLGTKVITEACKEYPNAVAALRAWVKTMKSCNANHPVELQKAFSYMDPVPPQTVFNICGNDYRLIAKNNYKHKVVRIQHVLTHADYDKNNWKESVP
jgi:mRNA interferase HigB